MINNFDKSYAGLNAQQKEAVDYIDGPLMVLAGPGTGKTQLLSLRVANILQKTDASAQNILCLTFTEKAANNMKQRMLEIIGVEARNVVVKTFHGLGAEIIAEYPDSFYNSARLEAAPEAIKLELVDTLLSALPFDNPLALKFAGQNTLVKDVQGAIEQAKKAGLTPQKLKAITEANLAYIDIVEPLLQPVLEQRLSMKTVTEFAELAVSLPDLPTNIPPFNPLSSVLKVSLAKAAADAEINNKTQSLSEWKSSWSEKSGERRVLKDRRRNEWWKALAGIYKSYQDRMHQDKYFDFSDMILDVLTNLEVDEGLRTELQERFRYIMIDEFQDTNDAQLRLAHLLASHESYEGSPNIMAVGDDDQAIYRFQGAEITNAQTFIDSYRNTRKIVLKENYRSHQTVIDKSTIVAEQIENRLVNQLEGLEKNITAAGNAEAGHIEHISYSSKAHQYSGMIKLARKYSKEGKTTAVLARKHSSLEQIAHILQKNDISIHYEKRNNIFELSSVKLIGNLLRIINAIARGDQERTNALLPRLLADKAFQINPLKLWQMAKLNYKDQQWLDTLLNGEDTELKSIADWLVGLSKLAQIEPLMIVFEHVLGLRELNGYVSPAKRYFSSVKTDSTYLQTLSAIQSLRALVMEFSRDDSPTLSRFIEFMDLNEDHGVTIADGSVFVSGNDALELMTVYKAKGLEFNTVIVVDCIEKMWSPRGRKRKPPANLESLQDYGEDADDYARLMFVAASRARSNLIFTSYSSDEHGEEVVATPLIHSVPKSEADESGMNIIEVAENVLVWPEIPKTDQRALLSDVLKNYQLSVTNLINFIDLENGGPGYYIERNLLRIPDVRTPSLAFGTAIHNALREAQLSVNKGNFNLNKIKQIFVGTLIKEQVENLQFPRYKEKGEKLIERLFKTPLLELKPGDFPEKRINDVVIGQARVRGDIDLLVRTADHWTVIDYKTGGELKTGLDSTTKTEGMKALKHRMQLNFYALLLREKGIAKAPDIIDGQMIYLEAKDARNFRKTHRANKQELDELAILINTVWHRIQHLDWPDTSKYSPDFSGTMEFIHDLIEEKI